MTRTLLSGGTVFDGTGAAPAVADVVIDGDTGLADDEEQQRKSPGRIGRGSCQFALCWASARRSVGDGVSNDVDDPTATTLAELDDAVLQGEQAVVFGQADVVARVEPGAALADQDAAGGDDRATEFLDSEALCVGVTTVAG